MILTSGSADKDSARAFGTAMAIAFVSLAAAAGINLIDRQPGIAVVGYLTILASLVSLLTSANLIWGHSVLSTSDAAKATWYSLIATLALGNTSGLLAGHDDNHPDRVKLVRAGTVVMLWALTITVVAGIQGNGDNVRLEQLGVTAVLYGIGALVLPLLRLAER
ncbi:MAG: hypothetical protein ACM3N0_10290 [Chloroflexota bacterium]